MMVFLFYAEKNYNYSWIEVYSIQYNSFIILTSTKYSKNNHLISLISVPSPWGLFVRLYDKYA